MDHFRPFFISLFDKWSIDVTNLVDLIKNIDLNCIPCPNWLSKFELTTFAQQYPNPNLLPPYQLSLVLNVFL